MKDRRCKLRLRPCGQYELGLDEELRSPLANFSSYSQPSTQSEVCLDLKANVCLLILQTAWCYCYFVVRSKINKHTIKEIQRLDIETESHLNELKSCWAGIEIVYSLCCPSFLSVFWHPTKYLTTSVIIVGMMSKLCSTSSAPGSDRVGKGLHPYFSLESNA